MNLNFRNPINKMAIIVRAKLDGVGEHSGVLMPNGSVAHNTEDRGVEIVSYHQFSAGKLVKIAKEIPMQQWVPTMHRINDEMRFPKKYHLLSNNCETFANRVSGYKAESHQVNFVTVALFFFGVITLANSAR